MKRYGSIKNIVRNFALAAAVPALLFSCMKATDPTTEEPSEDWSKTGTMELALARDAMDEVSVLPDVDTFRVAILNYRTGEVIKNQLTGLNYEWNAFREISGDVITLPSGKYHLEVANLKEELLSGWEAPYYYGLQEFTVKIGELSRIDLVCKMANMGVKVKFDDEFLSKISNPSVRVYTDYTDPQTAERVRADLFYSPEETRTGYFKIPADKQIYVSVTGIRLEDGEPMSPQTYILEADAATIATVTISYQQTGKASPSITVDYSTKDSQHTVEVPDSEGVIDGGDGNENWEGGGGTDPDPDGELSIVGSSFNGSTFDIDRQLTVSASVNNVIDVKFIAESGIKELWVTIESDALEPLLPMMDLEVKVPFDIANPPAVDENGSPLWVTAFAEDVIGILDPRNPIRDKTEHVFAVGGLMELLAGAADPQNNGADVHKFHLRVVDNSGQELNKSLSVYLTE